MKACFILLAVIFIISCSSKKKWTKDYAFKNCMNEASNSESLDSIIEEKYQYKLCNCLSEKAAVKYKSEEEAAKDSVGFFDMFDYCVEAVRAEIEK
jgi:hypothetical protein